MSNLPPPTSGGAPYEPPRQPDQPTVAFTPLPPIESPQPKKKSSKRLLIIIGAAVVVVAALVVGGLLVFGGDDGDGNVDAHKASGAVEDATTAANLGRDVHRAALKACPFDGIDDLAGDAPKGFDAATAAKGDDVAALTQTDQRDDPILLQCATANDDGTLAYGVATAALPPTELKAYIERSLNDATATFEDTSSFRGGTLLPFCTKPNDGATVQALCATTWYDKELMVAIFATGKGSATDLTTEWVKDELDDLITDLEGADSDNVEVTATAGFDLDASAARANLDKMIAAANVTAPDTTAEQDSCAIADLPALLTTAPSGLDQSAVADGQVDSVIASAADQGDPSLAQCLQSNSDNTVRFGVFVGDPAPADFEAYVKRSSGVPDATFDDPVAFRGGTLHAYCGKDDSGAVAFCETDWLSDDIQLGLFAGFDGITTDDTTAWLEANIDALLASVAAADATAVTPAAG
jgi:hypothetical protein